MLTAVPDPAVKSDAIAKLDGADFQRILGALDLGALEALKPQLTQIFAEYAADRARRSALEAIAAAGLSIDDVSRMLEQVNEHAVAWAAEEAATLVTEVSETTRSDLRELIQFGIDGGLSNQDLAAEIQGAFTFSPDRSILIARTETSFAENTGTRIGWEDSGVVDGKEWLLAAGACELCEENAAAGIIPLDAEFPSGDLNPPGHPNCRCAMTAAVKVAP